MMRNIWQLLSSICCIIAPMISCGAVPLSQYGQIQNVQKYSSNPFWNPNGTYNQTFPQPVYTTGPDISTSDCQNVVTSLIINHCAVNNNCDAAAISDIRPAIMLALSRLPGHNFATACAGYIDDAFNTYMRQRINIVPPTPFPAVSTSQQAKSDIGKSVISNTPPQWEKDVNDRTRELKQLQSQNGGTGTRIVKTEFPKTASDLSFVARMDNLTDGYLPFKDANPYETFDIETQEMAWQRRIDAMEQQRQNDEATMSLNEYCDKYLDTEKCNQTQSDIDDVIFSGYAHPVQETVTTTTTSSSIVSNQVESQNNTTTQSTVTPGQQQLVANNQQYLGWCTPPDLWTEQGFTEAMTKKYTTGRYFNVDQRFAKSILAILQAEGMTCATDPGNPKSITCYGFMQSANTDIDVRQLNLESAEDLAYQRYYRGLGIDKLPDSIAGDVLHVSFWRGPAKAIPTLCKLVGAKCADKQSTITDNIVNAAKNYTGDLHNDYWDKTWDELRANNRQSLWKAFARRVNHARNNGCLVTPRRPVRI